ncbi:MAG: hypothetical protein AAFU64_16800 [Bacteroidota bacterium]
MIFLQARPLLRESIQTLDLQAFSKESYISEALRFIQAWEQNQSEFEQMTSGSTGSPKKIHITRTQMQASIQASAQALGLQSGQKSLCCLNAQYIGGKMMLARALELQQELHIIPPQANPFASLIELYPPKALPRFDFSALVPLQLLQLLKASGIGGIE